MKENDKNKRPLKGSFTVEASIIVPLFLIMLGAGMKLTLTLYQEIVKSNEQDVLEDMWVVDDFYRIKIVDGLVDEVSDDK